MPLSPEEQRLISMVFNEVGLTHTLYRSRPLKRRISACLRKLRAGSVHAAIELLTKDPALRDEALSVFLIGSTELYRDSKVFDFLRFSHLPHLRKAKSSVTVWSVGCSSGAELVTLAALLAEADLLTDSLLRGSDIKRLAIFQARSGWYPETICRNMPEELLDKYFTPTASGYSANSELGSAKFKWEILNALSMKPEARGMWDIILCRNLAIYLEDKASRLLWANLRQALSPGGILVTGRAERPVGFTKISSCVFRKETPE